MAYTTYQLLQASIILAAVKQRLLQDDPDLEADEKLFSDMLDGEGGDAMDVVDAHLRAALHAEDMAEIAQKRAGEIMFRAARYINRAKQLREAVSATLDALGVKRRELPDMLATNKLGPRKVEITGTVPEDYKRYPPPVDDLRKIGEALRDGQSLDFAHLANGATYLEIRRK